MISTARRFLFVHVPKTGGNSVQNILRHYSEDSIITPDPHQDGVERFDVVSARYGTAKHSTLAAYREALGAALFASLFKFSIVRNPYDRLISHYFSPHRGVKAWDREAFRAMLAAVHPAEHYLLLGQPDEPPAGDVADSIDRAALPLDHDLNLVMRFEHLDDDFAHLCRMLEIPRRPLPRRNRSERRHYSCYYDDELREIVARRYRREIELGGYEFEALRHRAG